MDVRLSLEMQERSRFGVSCWPFSSSIVGLLWTILTNEWGFELPNVPNHSQKWQIHSGRAIASKIGWKCLEQIVLAEEVNVWKQTSGETPELGTL